MKKTRLIIFALCAFALNVSAQTMEGYLETVATDYHLISVGTWEYTNDVKQSGDVNAGESTRKSLITKTQAAMTKLSGLGGWQGDASFSDAVMRH